MTLNWAVVLQHCVLITGFIWKLEGWMCFFRKYRLVCYSVVCIQNGTWLVLNHVSASDLLYLHIQLHQLIVHRKFGHQVQVISMCVAINQMVLRKNFQIDIALESQVIEGSISGLIHNIMFTIKGNNWVYISQFTLAWLILRPTPM